MLDGHWLSELSSVEHQLKGHLKGSHVRYNLFLVVLILLFEVSHCLHLKRFLLGSQELNSEIGGL